MRANVPHEWSIPQVVAGSLVPVPANGIWSGLPVDCVLTTFSGRKLQKDTYCSLQSNSVLCLQVVSVGSPIIRGLIVKAFDCFAVSGPICARSFVSYYLADEQKKAWKVPFTHLSSCPSVSIGHNHLLTRIRRAGDGVPPVRNDEMIDGGPDSSDGVETQVIGNGKIRLHMCEDVFMQGKRFVLFDALVVDLWMEEGAELDFEKFAKKYRNARRAGPLPANIEQLKLPRIAKSEF